MQGTLCKPRGFSRVAAAVSSGVIVGNERDQRHNAVNAVNAVNALSVHTHPGQVDGELAHDWLGPLKGIKQPIYKPGSQARKGHLPRQRVQRRKVRA